MIARRDLPWGLDRTEQGLEVYEKLEELVEIPHRTRWANERLIVHVGADDCICPVFHAVLRLALPHFPEQAGEILLTTEQAVVVAQPREIERSSLHRDQGADVGLVASAT